MILFFFFFLRTGWVGCALPHLTLLCVGTCHVILFPWVPCDALFAATLAIWYMTISHKCAWYYSPVLVQWHGQQYFLNVLWGWFILPRDTHRLILSCGGMYVTKIFFMKFIELVLIKKYFLMYLHCIISWSLPFFWQWSSGTRSWILYFWSTVEGIKILTLLPSTAYWKEYVNTIEKTHSEGPTSWCVIYNIIYNYNTA